MANPGLPRPPTSARLSAVVAVSPRAHGNVALRPSPGDAVVAVPVVARAHDAVDRTSHERAAQAPSPCHLGSTRDVAAPCRGLPTRHGHRREKIGRGVRLRCHCPRAQVSVVAG